MCFIKQNGCIFVVLQKEKKLCFHSVQLKTCARCVFVLVGLAVLGPALEEVGEEVVFILLISKW